MDIIEKAVGKHNNPRKASLVEKAAEKLGEGGRGGDDPSTGAGRTTAGAAASLPSQGAPARASKRVEIDFARLRTAGIETGDDDRSQTAAEYRLIKRPLLVTASRRGPDAIRNGHLIMVTSAKPKEGKTFTAINLAMSIAAERDLTVLLVDADLTKPSILSIFGIEADKGLVDLLEGDGVDVADVMLRTNRDNLSIIPAGRSCKQATELLASERMARFAEDIAKRYADRVVIFDAPPVLASSEPSVLALHVGQIVFVVEAERTGKAEIEEALNLVNACKNVGLILNKSRSRWKVDRLGSKYDHVR